MPSDYFRPETSKETILWDYFYSVITDAMLDMMSGLDYSKLRICDLGCGNGDFAVHFLTKLKTKHALPALYCGIDFSKESVELAKNKLVELFPNVTFDIREGDLLNNLPFPSSSFDLIVSNVVLHNFEPKSTALKNATSLLAQSGLLLISDLFHHDGNESADIKDRSKARKRFRAGLTPEQVERYLDIATNEEDPRSVAYTFAKEFVMSSKDFENIVKSLNCEVRGFCKDAAPFVHIFGVKQNPLFRYVQEKAIQDLRLRKSLSEDLADALNSNEWLDHLRKLITEKDKDWLKEAVLSNRTHVGELCVNLMRPIRDESDVREFLFEQWQSSTEYWMKMQVMWRLLDYSDLEESMHKGIYEFVRSDWNKWLIYTVDKFGGNNKVLESSKKRLGDPLFPESKAWVYLCIAAGSDNKSEAKNLITGYTKSESSINAMVAQDLLNLLDK